VNLWGDQLFEGEAVSVRKFANAVISLNDYELPRSGHDQLMWVVGMRGKESIGGFLHLTNYRLVFTAHAVNRLYGHFSILLPSITAVRNSSHGLVKQVEITSMGHRFTFVVWGVPKLIESIDRLTRQVTPDQAAWLSNAAVANPVITGEGLKRR
jgi:hypothetical protein